MTFRNLRAAMGLNRTPQPPLSLLSPTPMGPGPLAWRHQSLPSDTAAVVVPAPKSSALPGTSANVPTWPWPVPVPMGMPKAHGWVCLQLPPCSVLFPGWGQQDQRGLWCLALLAPTQIPSPPAHQHSGSHQSLLHSDDYRLFIIVKIAMPMNKVKYYSSLISHSE